MSAFLCLCVLAAMWIASRFAHVGPFEGDLSPATLAMVDRVERERREAHELAMQLARDVGGPVPLAVDPFDARAVRVIPTAQYEYEEMRRAANAKPHAVDRKERAS